MDDLFEETESEPYHFVVLDSQDTENIPPSSWNDTSILKSLPALQITETQYDLELTTIPDSQLSPIHNYQVSETHLFDGELDDSCSFDSVKLRRKLMDDQNILIDESCSQSSSTSGSSGNFERSLNQSVIEKPKSSPCSKGSPEKDFSVKQDIGSNDTKTNTEIPSTSFPRKMSKDPNPTILSRKSLFKNYQEDTESDEKEIPHPIVSTPSTHIASLQFSQESMLVPDTADEMNYVEPSPEHNPTPTIIPDSPTLSLTQDSDDDTQDPTVIERSVIKQEEPPKILDTTIEHIAEDSIKESQNFQLYLDTQASMMSQVERNKSLEKPMIIEKSKIEERYSHHDMSESEDLDLHLSLNTQNESFKEITSQRSGSSSKMGISQSPATPKDNSNEEIKFKLILPPSVQSLSNSSKEEFSQMHFEESSSICHKSKLPEALKTSQPETSQGIPCVQHKIISQEKVADPKTEIKVSQNVKFPDMLPDAQEKDSTAIFTKFQKVRCQDVELGSQKIDSSVSQKEASNVESQKGYSQKMLSSSQKEDFHVRSQKVYPEKTILSSQKQDTLDESQKDYSQVIMLSSQKEDSYVESQKEYSQIGAPSFQKGHSSSEFQKGRSQNVTTTSQKKNSFSEPPQKYSQKMISSSQEEDSHVDSQNIYSPNPTAGNQEKCSPAESQKEYSENIVPSSQKEVFCVESQKSCSQNVAPSFQKGNSPIESQMGYSQNIHSSQKENSSCEPPNSSIQNVVLSSQKGYTPAESQKDHSQNILLSSQKESSVTCSQKDHLQDKNSQRENIKERSHDSQKRISKNTSATSQQGHSHGILPVSQEQDNPATVSESQVVKETEETTGISQRENSQHSSNDSQKKNTQDMLSHSQKKDSQEIASFLQREHQDSQKGNLSFSATKELSQTKSQTDESQGVLSCKANSPDKLSQSQKENPQNLLLGSQRKDSQEMVKNALNVSAESQEKNFQSLTPTKGNSQDISESSKKDYTSLLAQEKPLGMSPHSKKEDSQYTQPSSEKHDTSTSQEKSSDHQAELQSQIVVHSASKKKTIDLSVESQGTRSQPEIPVIPKSDLQSRISVMDSSNVLLTEIGTVSSDKDKITIESKFQKLSHSQPSEPHKCQVHDMKQSSSSQDSALKPLSNLKLLATSSQKSVFTSEMTLPTDKGTVDSKNLIAKEEPISVDNENLVQTPEKLVAIALGPIGNFQDASSLPRRQDVSFSKPVMFLSQERDVCVKKEETLSTSQPSLINKSKYNQHEIKPGMVKDFVNEETLLFSSPVKMKTQEQHKELNLSGSHQLSSLKTLSLPDSDSQDSENGTLENREISEKISNPEKMEVDSVTVGLPSKPNVCYLKDSGHSQGSSTITLTQSHQFEIYTSPIEASEKLNNNVKDASDLSAQTAHDENFISNPNQEHSQTLTPLSKSLTVIKPKSKRKSHEIPEASSTMYPSQTSASQQKHTPLQMQSQHAVKSSTARYNVVSSNQADKTEKQPVAGPSNDPYLFIGSQPKIFSQAVKSRKKPRRSKVLSKSAQRRMQKKNFLKKKNSLSKRNWTIRKDYKSPVHRVRFEPLRRRTPSLKHPKDESLFLKVPSYQDIETIFSKKNNLNEQVKSCSSDGSTQPFDNKDSQQHQTLFSNLQNVLQRRIVDETVVQLVYRKITVETMKNAKVVSSRTIVEKDDPVIIRRNQNEDFKYLNLAKGVSPFCSPNSLTSGEYADVSSFSHSDSKTSNSSSFGSLTTKQSRSEMPMSPLVQHTVSQIKKGNVSGPQAGQAVTLRQLHSSGTDDDLMKAPSPITSVYKNAHSVYGSAEELHTVNQSCDVGGSYVAETVPHLEVSSGDPVKSRATGIQNSDSLFSSTENLNISDSGLSTTLARQEPDVKESQSLVDGLVQGADQSITLHVESAAEASEIDLTTPPASQKWSTFQKRKLSHFAENPEDTGLDEHPCIKRSRKASEDGTSLQPTKTSEECGSPEISLQNFQQQIKMPSLSPESSTKGKTGIGIKIMAKWKDGYFYPGMTASLEKGGKFLIDFADGDQLWVKINQILTVNYLPQGQSVMVQSKDNFFDSGMIVDHIESNSDSSDSFLYRIEMDDNTIVNCTRQQVILSEDQAAILLSDEEYQMTSTVTTTPQPSGADVSLDNLVEGCRRSAKKVVDVSSEKMESRSSKRTKLVKIEPQAMSTPTPKRRARSFKKDSKDSENLIGAAVSSPKNPKYDKTPNFKKGLFDAVKGPIPTQKTLFKGMNFLLTNTEKSQEQKLMDKKMIQDFSSESSANVYYSDIDEPEVPFDKQHLQVQIEAGGGTVFDSWSDKFAARRTKSFIISGSYQRTVKYLQGLAAGIICVSHLWIRDCCKHGMLCDYKSYTLPAGISLKKKNLIECKLKSQCLKDTDVLVFSTNPDFVSTWSEILVLAGCNIVKKFKKTRDQSHDVDIVITDKTCSVQIKKQAELYNTPLLSTEWVIQCLIHGQKLCYTEHEKYKFDYEEEK